MFDADFFFQCIERGVTETYILYYYDAGVGVYEDAKKRVATKGEAWTDRGRRRFADG